MRQAKSVGNDRVLTALAQTVAEVDPVDLAGKPLPAPPREAEAATRYVEGDELGRGGLGVVVEAFDQDLRRAVALKRPRSDRMGERHVASLIREAQITAQLEHPNIVGVHTLGIDGQGRPFFSMTRLGGQSLGRLLAARREDPELRRQLSTPRLLRILLQVGNAVAFGHSRGVLHRDLKPDNIMVGDFGEVRLMDWGIAKILGEAGDPAQEQAALSLSAPHTETQAGAFMGTPGYAAPEQVEGRKDIDPRADVYALGALLYEMLAGRPPVTERSMSAAMLATVQGKIPVIQSLVPVSDRLAAIVHKALATAREERYGDVPALLADVEALMEGRPVSALEEGALKRAGRWYFGRSLRVARLRNLDIDLMCWGCFMFGITSGMFLLHWGGTSVRFLWWICAVLGLLAFIPPAYTMLRQERPDDPGALLAFGEGLTTTARTSAPTEAMGSATTEIDEEIG